MSSRFARSLLVLLATINICGRAQSIFATLMNVVNLRFVSDVRKKEIYFFARPSVCSYLSLPC